MNRYNNFTKCIICLKPHSNEIKQRSLTDEHIVSEFLGGKITVKNVCKECNDRLGLKLEGPLSNNLHLKLYTYSNQIKGKKDKLYNPLAGTYSYENINFSFRK